MPSVDPTKTATLRRRYAQAMNRRFRALAKDVRISVVDRDGFGLLRTNDPAPTHAFDFPRSADKTAAFSRWLRREIDRGILEVIVRQGDEIVLHREWQNEFLRSGYVRGVVDTETELLRGGRLSAPLDIAIGIEAGVHAETLELLYTRSFEGLRGITGTMSGRLSEILSQSLIDGVGPRVMAKRITDQMASISRTRAMVLARTETIRAYAEASLNTYEANGVEGLEADVEFLTATDNRVCQRCLRLAGRVFTVAQARGVIPVHPRCLPGDAVITASPRISAAFKRWYDGEMVIIRTASGKDLVSTPNHPVLTSQGWVPAVKLNTRDQIVGCTPRHGEMIRMADHDHMPARVEEIAESFFRSPQVSTAEMPISPEDFYGDGVGSDVYIVGTDIKLLGDFDTSGSQHLNHGNFEGGDTGLPNEFCAGSLDTLVEWLYPSPARTVGFGRLPFARFGVFGPPFNALGFGTTPGVDATDYQSASDRRSRNPESLGNGIFRTAGSIQGDNFRSRDIDLLSMPDSDALVPQFPKEPAVWDVGSISKMLGRSTSEIFLDQVLSKESHKFSGYVYDLETDGGYFITQNLVAHNCRCRWIAVLPNEDDRDVREREARRRRAERELAKLDT